MAKEQSFSFPPRGHVALLAYDPAADVFRVVAVDASGNLQVGMGGGGGLESDLYAWDGSTWQKLLAQTAANPNLQVALRDGAVQAHVAAPNADNFSPSTPGLFVVGHLYGFDGATWDRLRCGGGALNANNVPRIPQGVTDLSGRQLGSLANGYWIELLSGTLGATLASLSGRIVAAGKRLCVAWESGVAAITAGIVQCGVAYDDVVVLQNAGPTGQVLVSPSVVFNCVGDGSKLWKVWALNQTGATQSVAISALCWEEDAF